MGDLHRTQALLAELERDSSEQYRPHLSQTYDSSFEFCKEWLRCLFLSSNSMRFLVPFLAVIEGSDM